nr:hypothetical protein [Tanacetum cinerariifolium]
KLQQVSLDAVDSGPIFDKEPEQKVQNDDHYDVFAIECQHPEQYESVYKTYLIKQDAHNVLIESEDMNYDSEQIDQNDKDADFAEEHAQIKLYKSHEDKEIEKVIHLENKVKVLDNIVYKTGQTVQTMNMLNNKCRTSFVKPEYLKIAKQANPRLYDIGCYNDNLALLLSPESDEVIRLEKESRSKLSDLIRPFDYAKLNSLYDLFVPQHEKSSEQRLFSERSRVSHITVQKQKKSFNKQPTLLEKRLDQSIPLGKQCQSSLDLFKVIIPATTIFNGVEMCKKSVTKSTYFGYLDPQNFSPEIERILNGLNQFQRCLKEEMVTDLRYFNSFEFEVDSFRSQLETQKTQFSNEIDRLS